jgi:hypothetical protein
MSKVRTAVVPCLVLASLAFGAVSFYAHSQSSAPEDKYIWLEDVNSPRAMDWVKSENARTAKVLEADPRFATTKPSRSAKTPAASPSPASAATTYSISGTTRKTFAAFSAKPLSPTTPPPLRTGKPSSTSTPSISKKAKVGSSTAPPASIPATNTACSTSPSAAKTPPRRASST